MGTRARVEVNKSTSDNFHDKTLHALSLSIFSENGAEASAALCELLRWSALKPDSAPIPATATLTYPQPTPCLISSLTRFVSAYSNRWGHAPTIEPTLVALNILANLTNVADPQTAVRNCFAIGAVPETVLLLHRLSYHPHSPARRICQTLMIRIGRFCDIEHTLRPADAASIVASLASLFMISDPGTDEAHIQIFLNFALLSKNLRLFVRELAPETLCRRIGDLLAYPLGSLRDLLLESAYAFIMTNSEIKDAAGSTISFLRNVLGLAIPPSEPYETKLFVSFSPHQKACVLLLEMSEDGRVVEYLARFKQQIAAAVLKWRSAALYGLALKVSNVSTQ
jgi:hypothetical protein